MQLELKHITKSFTGKEVLKGISLCAESGTAFGLLGRNGAGKTTTIRILMNVFPADSGEILIDGQKIDYNTIKLGYLPEERGLYPKKKINDQLLYFAELNGMRAKDAQKSIDRWLDRLGMAEYKNQKLNTLSKGNQQKIPGYHYFGRAVLRTGPRERHAFKRGCERRDRARKDRAVFQSPNELYRGILRLHRHFKRR